MSFFLKKKKKIIMSDIGLSFCFSAFFSEISALSAVKAFSLLVFGPRLRCALCGDSFSVSRCRKNPKTLPNRAILDHLFREDKRSDTFGHGQLWEWMNNAGALHRCGRGGIIKSITRIPAVNFEGAINRLTTETLDSNNKLDKNAWQDFKKLHVRRTDRNQIQPNQHWSQGLEIAIPVNPVSPVIDSSLSFSPFLLFLRVL